MKNSAERYMSAKDAAKHLNIHLNTVYKLINTDRIEAIRYGRRVFVVREDLDNIMIARDDAGAIQAIFRDDLDDVTETAVNKKEIV